MMALSFKNILQILLTPLPSCLKVPGYRLLGARIGPGARIAAYAVLVADDIDIGPMAKIKALTLITGLKSLKMGAYSGISNLCVINGPSSLNLGPRSFIGPGCMIDLDASVTIGEYSGISPRSTILTHGIFLPSSWGYRRKIGPVVIGDLVWISNNCKIGAGVTIASEAILLPNSTVHSDVPTACLLHDSSLKRAQFPLALLQKRMTREWLEEFILEVTEAFCQECLKSIGYQANREQGRVVLVRDTRRVVICFSGLSPLAYHPTQPLETGGEHWLFGYNLDDHMLGGGDRLQALDFLRLLHSPNASPLLKEAVKYFQHAWGLRFADWRYRDHFRLSPPQFASSAAPTEE